MRIESKKHVLLCVSAILSASLYFIAMDDEDKLNIKGEEWFVGIAYDVKESPKGFVFSLEDCNGESIRCFSREEPVSDALYKVKGDWSEDHAILFLKIMKKHQ